eukprot:3939038-Rhodomonas_salina.2
MIPPTPTAAGGPEEYGKEERGDGIGGGREEARERKGSSPNRGKEVDPWVQGDAGAARGVRKLRTLHWHDGGKLLSDEGLGGREGGVHRAASQRGRVSRSTAHRQVSGQSESELNRSATRNWPTIAALREGGGREGCLLYTSPSPRDRG